MVNWKLRYEEAHKQWQLKEYPASCKDFGWISPKYPDVRTSNGLTRMILYFLKWEGWRATRINTMGRLIDGPQKQDSGISLITKKFIPSTTRKGTADISATIKGRSVMLEIKISGDTRRPEQLREQELERQAGGVYEFISDPDEFFIWYDSFLLSLK
jgi:hypothetical protein